jgi:hypothetical protein
MICGAAFNSWSENRWVRPKVTAPRAALTTRAEPGHAGPWSSASSRLLGTLGSNSGQRTSLSFLRHARAVAPPPRSRRFGSTQRPRPVRRPGQRLRSPPGCSAARRRPRATQKSTPVLRTGMQPARVPLSFARMLSSLSRCCFQQPALRQYQIASPAC